MIIQRTHYAIYVGDIDKYTMSQTIVVYCTWKQNYQISY